MDSNTDNKCHFTKEDLKKFGYNITIGDFRDRIKIEEEKEIGRKEKK